MNIYKIIVTWCLLLLLLPVYAQVRVATALCDNRINPTGIHTQAFFFSWQLVSQKNNQKQTAYQLVIASSKSMLDRQQYDIYNSRIVKSNQSIQVIYKGPALLPGRTYYWKVKVWDASNVASQWSEPQTFITGLFEPSDWGAARWIGAESASPDTRVVPFVHGKLKENDPRIIKSKAAPLLRKSFFVAKPVKSALLFISGLGHYQASINGAKIGNAFLAPGWTTYDKTVLYNTYDITNDLSKGNNVIGVVLGDGFYNVSQERYVKGTGSFGKPKMIAQLKIIYTDGSEEYVVSDTSWKTKPSPIVFNNIYGGEDFDARFIEKKWNTGSYNDREWKPALLAAVPKGRLLPEIDYPVTIMDTLSVKSVKVIGDNKACYDFGQNISGIPQIKIKGKPGQTVKLIPAELVLDNGNVNQADGVTPHFYQYTIGSNDEETWHPNFSYFAARYVQVEGAGIKNQQANDDRPVITDIKLLHNRNSAPANGDFICSDSLLNRIYQLVDWAIKSNIQSYITDNPQREKLSWQGEQNFMRAAINYGYDVYNLYRSLVQNMKDAQHSNGLIPDIAPEYIQFDGPFVDSPEWGTTGMLDLWFLYSCYGDTAIIRNAYPMMRAYAQYLQTKAENHLLLYGLGDWLDVGNVTPKGLTATAYYYKAIAALGTMAAIIGEKQDASFYQQLSDSIKQSFNHKFFNEEKKIYATGSQTAMAMPLSLGMVDEKNKKEVLDNLIHQIESIDGNRITAGDVGHRFLVKALYENNHPEVLYNITKRGDVPGYAYQLNLGATALIETWDGKASQNQLAMGHILEWFYEGIAGIRQDKQSVAFKNIIIQPQVVGAITSASGSFHSPYGWIKSNWELKQNMFSIDIEIPVNTQAKVILPARSNSKIWMNGRKLDGWKWDNETVTLQVNAGKYTINIK
ncbi:family 78 glycoside hydrolase catalytic domain [Chitinophaga defluvii]|uniref:alpha-L-rhamnosidase n=1 Tax=Chitinophaga defluvii TaxID=3163343 RepID=A0ABV2T6H1_9BACT